MGNLKNKNILVTGGTGFIGSHLFEELVKQEANIINLSLPAHPKSYFYSQKLDKKIKTVIFDICDLDKFLSLIKKNKIDFIFHLAAQALVDEAYAQPHRTYLTNTLGTVNILEGVRKFPQIKGIVVASSDKAYGKLNKKKYQETDPLKGDHPYETSKSAADLIAHSYYKTYHLPITVTRFGNVYGEGDLNFSRLIPGIMKSVIENKVFKIRSDGKYVRDYIYVGDVVAGYILLAENMGEIKEWHLILAQKKLYLSCKL